MKLPTDFPNFTRLEKEDQGFIDSLFDHLPPYSDHTFSSLWTWNSDNKSEICRLNDNLVISMSDYLSNQPTLTYLGQNKIGQTLQTLFDYLNGAKFRQPELRLIGQACLKNVNENDYGIFEDPDNFDYIYSLQDLALLKGRSYRGPKNFVNRFQKNYPGQVKELNLARDDDWQRIQLVYKKWSQRQKEKNNDIRHESQALAKIKDISPQLNLYTLGIFVDGQLIAYSLNELNNKDYATNLFEHADTDFIGIFPQLKNQTALKLSQKGYKFLSHQQDLGLPSLKFSKQSWHPAFYLKKYTVRGKAEVL